MMKILLIALSLVMVGCETIPGNVAVGVGNFIITGPMRAHFFSSCPEPELTEDTPGS